MVPHKLYLTKFNYEQVFINGQIRMNVEFAKYSNKTYACLNVNIQLLCKAANLLMFFLPKYIWIAFHNAMWCTHTHTHTHTCTHAHTHTRTHTRIIMCVCVYHMAWWIAVQMYIDRKTLFLHFNVLWPGHLYQKF